MSGLPVVTTNVGSVPEIVINNVTGIITNLEVQDIANALEKLTNDKALREKFGKAAQRYTLDNYGIGRLVNDHENLYRKLLLNQAMS
jgi:glycosyltransferase involved in cell wall biosynthesis